MVESYLPHATPISELRDYVAALQPDLHWKNSSFQSHSDGTNTYFIKAMAAYIEIIQKWVRNRSTTPFKLYTDTDTKLHLGLW